MDQRVRRTDGIIRERTARMIESKENRHNDLGVRKTNRTIIAEGEQTE
jgi:hypothetical protein